MALTEQELSFCREALGLILDASDDIGSCKIERDVDFEQIFFKDHRCSDNIRELLFNIMSANSKVILLLTCCQYYINPPVNYPTYKLRRWSRLHALSMICDDELSTMFTRDYESDYDKCYATCYAVNLDRLDLLGIGLPEPYFNKTLCDDFLQRMDEEIVRKVKEAYNKCPSLDNRVYQHEVVLGELNGLLNFFKLIKDFDLIRRNKAFTTCVQDNWDFTYNPVYDDYINRRLVIDSTENDVKDKDEDEVSTCARCVYEILLDDDKINKEMLATTFGIK